jgi:hypothetical protein
MPNMNTPSATDSSAFTQADIFAALALAGNHPVSCPKHGRPSSTVMFRRGHAKHVYSCDCVWDTETGTLRSHDDDGEN